MLESENILLKRFVNTGDAKAFSEIARRHAGMVYGACLRVLEDRNKASDAAQDTFFQLLRSAGQISGSIPAWLHKVATRKAVDAIRRDSARRQREQQYAVDKPCHVDKWEEMSQYIDEELNELDEQVREILIQHFFEGQRIEEITAATGLSQSTIYRRIESGVSQLRDKLSKRGIIVASAAFFSLLAENTVQAAPAVVLQELGKMALMGAPVAAASSAGITTVAAGTKTAAGTILTAVKANIVTAAVVTTVGVGAVVTYNQVTKETPQSSPRSESNYYQNSTLTDRPAAPTRKISTPSKVVIEPEPVYEVPPQPASEDYSSQEQAVTESSAAESATDTGARGGYGYVGMQARGGYAVNRAEKTEEPNNIEDKEPQLRGRRRRSD